MFDLLSPRILHAAVNPFVSKNAICTLDQLVQNSYANMTILIRYCNSRESFAIDIIHNEVAVNYIVHCSVATQTTIGHFTTHCRLYATKQNTVASKKSTTALTSRASVNELQHTFMAQIN